VGCEVWGVTSRLLVVDYSSLRVIEQVGEAIEETRVRSDLNVSGSDLYISRYDLYISRSCPYISRSDLNIWTPRSAPSQQLHSHSPAPACHHPQLFIKFFPLLPTYLLSEV